MKTINITAYQIFDEYSEAASGLHKSPQEAWAEIIEKHPALDFLVNQPGDILTAVNTGKCNFSLEKISVDGIFKE